MQHANKASKSKFVGNSVFVLFDDSDGSPIFSPSQRLPRRSGAS